MTAWDEGDDDVTRRAWSTTRPRWYQCTVTRLALAALVGGLLGANGPLLLHGAYLFLVEPCAFHAATLDGKGSNANGSAFVDVRYLRNGVQDTIDVSNGFYEQARPGQRVWVNQCQRGLGAVKNTYLETTPQQEGLDAPQSSND